MRRIEKHVHSTKVSHGSLTKLLSKQMKWFSIRKSFGGWEECHATLAAIEVRLVNNHVGIYQVVKALQRQNVVETTISTLLFHLIRLRKRPMWPGKIRIRANKNKILCHCLCSNFFISMEIGILTGRQVLHSLLDLYFSKNFL